MKVYVAVGKRIDCNKNYVALISGKKREIIATKDSKVIDEIVSAKGLERVSLLICDTLKMHSKDFNRAVHSELKNLGYSFK